MMTYEQHLKNVCVFRLALESLSKQIRGGVYVSLLALQHPPGLVRGGVAGVGCYAALKQLPSLMGEW